MMYLAIAPPQLQWLGAFDPVDEMYGWFADAEKSEWAALLGLNAVTVAPDILGLASSNPIAKGVVAPGEPTPATVLAAVADKSRDRTSLESSSLRFHSMAELWAIAMRMIVHQVNSSLFLGILSGN